MQMKSAKDTVLTLLTTEIKTEAYDCLLGELLASSNEIQSEVLTLLRGVQLENTISIDIQKRISFLIFWLHDLSQIEFTKPSDYHSFLLTVTDISDRVNQQMS
jgi:hypothetical protein